MIKLTRKKKLALYLFLMISGLIGGMIVYSLLKDRNKKLAEKLLKIGVVGPLVFYGSIIFLLATLSYVRLLTEERSSIFRDGIISILLSPLLPETAEKN